MSDADWEPWVRHDGSGCPVRVGTLAQVQMGDGMLVEGTVTDCAQNPPEGTVSRWKWPVLMPWCVASYRVRKPKALLDLIKLAEGQPVFTRVDWGRELVDAP